MTHEISLADAATMTSRYRDNSNNILAETYQDQAILPQCETFGKDSVLALMGQDGVAGLRVYYGMDSNLKVHAILVGVDEQGADIIPTTNNDEGVILEDAQRCPPACPPASPLNED